MNDSSCFGLYWDGTESSECTQGSGCGILDDCLAKFASTTLVAYQAELGSEATVENLSKKTSISTEAIELALKFQASMGITVEESSESEVIDAPDFPEPPESIEADSPPPPDLNTPVEAPEPPEKAEPENALQPDADSTQVTDTKQLETGDTEQSGQPESVVEDTPKKPTKKKRKKRAAKKKVTKKKAVKDQVDPPLAKSAQCVTDLAETVQTQSVPNASAQGVKVRSWGQQFNQSRWERERKRTPEIAQLVPGMKLERLWKGELTVTTVHKGYYEYNGNQYPTLYSVVVAITGTRPCLKQKRADGTRLNGSRQMTSWSAVRFYKLKQLFPKAKKNK